MDLDKFSIKVSYRTYRYTLGGLFLAWGLINLVDIYTLADVDILNTWKAFIGIIIMFVYVTFEPRVVTF